jgi:polyhydroxyalkanoate synthesis regulator phasin
MFKRWLSLVTGSMIAVFALATPDARAAEDSQSLEELRNTVIGLLDALVQRGVMTSEQAQAMVAAAQQKAAAASRSRAAGEDSERDAVRVTYVPEIVQQQISDRVRHDIREDVVGDVAKLAKRELWGVPAALPEWARNVDLYGDVRARAEGALYASGNATNVYLDFNAVNAAGGVGSAGLDALLNTAENRPRMVGRARVGLKARLGGHFTADVRLASGNARSPTSTNQTLGNYGGRWTVNLDRASVRWAPTYTRNRQEFDLRFGRFSNPFASASELIWDSDLTFEGLSAGYAFDLFDRSPQRMERGLFLTVGAFPLQEEELSSDDKWLLGGQLGAELPIGELSSVRVAVGYFDFLNIAGLRNSFGSSLLDFTAPRFLQKGNTLFDIRNDSNPSTNLYALAGDYRLLNANLWFDLGAFGNTHVMIGGDYVENIGWKRSDVLARTGLDIDERVSGYDAGVNFGWPTIADRWQWRAFMQYRYLERDAVLDAFADSDFHLGGTDAKGYQFGLDLGLSRGTWLRLRYLSADEIDGPPLGIDVWQLDINSQF